MLRRIAVLITSLFITTLVSADTPDFYLRASGVASKFHFKEHLIGYEIDVGYSFHSQLAFEAKYIDYGSQDNGPIVGCSGMKFESDGYSLQLVAMSPPERIIIFGKLGYLWWKSESKTGGFSGPRQFKSDGRELIKGVGIKIPVSDRLSVSTEYVISTVDDDDVTWKSLGMEVKL